MRAGGAAVAEFGELQVSRITIKISEKFSELDEYFEEYRGIGISNIRVLGK